jgi:5-formyltetrahydrofolate cyclo-ligase
MSRGVWNIPIPAEGETVIPDVLIAPLVGFDSSGFRLGYGGGFYDRTIAHCQVKPLIIGIGFELGRLPTIYPQAHDIAMDLIVTENSYCARDSSIAFS